MNVVYYDDTLWGTRRAARWLYLLLALLLLPALTWRLGRGEKLIVNAVLVMLTVLPFWVGHHAWAYLREQEKQHTEATPEMTVAFRCLTGYPMAFSVFLMILLWEM